MSLNSTPSRQQRESEKIVDLALHRMRTDAVVKEHRVEQRYTWLKRSVVVIAVGLLIVAGTRDYVHQIPESSVTDEGMTVVTLKQDAQGHYFAKGMINGESVNFLLDTGATAVSIPESIAKSLNLPYGKRQQHFTANGIAFGYSTTLKTVSLGGIEKRYVDASISPGMTGDQILLGMSFLKSLNIQQSSGVMEISQP